jgi:hypothetical protein
VTIQDHASQPLGNCFFVDSFPFGGLLAWSVVDLVRRHGRDRGKSVAFHVPLWRAPVVNPGLGLGCVVFALFLQGILKDVSPVPTE